MSSPKSNTARRREVRRHIARQEMRWSHWLLRRDVGWSALFVIMLTILGGVLAVESTSQGHYRVGQKLHQAVVARVEFSVENKEQTQRERDRATDRTPSVYIPDDLFSLDVRTRIGLLGQIGQDKKTKSFDELDPKHVEQLHLTEETFRALRKAVVSRAWSQRVDRFIVLLQELAIIEKKRFEIDTNVERMPGRIEIYQAFDQRYLKRAFTEIYNVEDPASYKKEIDRIGLEAFDDQALGKTVSAVVLEQMQPSVAFDETRTRLRKEQNAQAVKPELENYTPNVVIIEADHLLSASDVRKLTAERLMHDKLAGPWRKALKHLGIMGLVFLLAVGLWAYIWVYYHRITDNPMRGLALTGLLVGCMGLSVLAAVMFDFQYLVAFAAFPCLLTAILIAIGYDQRLALVVGAVQALLITLALQVGIGFLVLLLGGVLTAVRQLADVRSRTKVVWVGIGSGATMALGAICLGLVDQALYPQVDLKEFLSMTGVDAGLAATTGLMVGLFVQGVLPGVEKIMKVTTSMTLKELNDASHPLLRRLAQQAPGTHQHSLRIADMSEAAADAIGANALLSRVGAMYHDVGKSNKPHYFIENQGDGPNRHSKLSPAMSLLIIVGHVKDGIEMAREYRLPREVIHFIESHHGTTLVEYFYHAARKISNEQDVPAPPEFEFRYPGPKPRTREAAILMLAD
jgi:putative nucleotidyltransferase with HDIG domain